MANRILSGFSWTSKCDGSPLEFVQNILAQVAAEARELAIKDAGNVVAEHIQGTLELVNMGDATFAEIRYELKKLEAIHRDVLALKSPKKEGA